MFLHIIRITLSGAKPPTNIQNEDLHRAVQSQQKIGFYNMVVGFISHDWTKALKAFGTEHPKTKMEFLLSKLWDDICEPIWAARNNILHNKKNHVSKDEMIQLRDKLHWYQRHQDEVLDYRHRFLVDFSPEDADRWTRATRRAKLSMLDNARTFYKMQLHNRSKNQSTISDWVHSYTKLRSGRLIGPGLRQSTHEPYTYEYDSDSSDEAEFTWDPKAPCQSSHPTS
jgi:hypothetical protein